MGIVAGGVFSMLQKHFTLLVSLGYLAGHISLVLLGIDSGDETLLCLEIESHGVALVGVASHLEDRSAKQYTSGISRTCGVNKATVEIHVYLVALKVHVLILHVRVSVEMSQASGSLVGKRVFGSVFHRRVDAVFPSSVDAVESKRIVNSLIVVVYGKLQRVHLCSVRTCCQCCCVFLLWCLAFCGVLWHRVGSQCRAVLPVRISSSAIISWRYRCP